MNRPNAIHKAMKYLALPLLQIACLLHTPVHAAEDTFSLAKLDAPIGFSIGGPDEVNQRALQTLKLINETKPKWEQTYNSTRAAAVKAQRRLMLATNALHLASANAAGTQTEASWDALAKAAQTQRARQTDFQNAVKAWSVQYGRYTRLRARRVFVYHQIYEHKPLHANFYGLEGVKEFYELTPDPILEAWEQQRDEIFESLSTFTANIKQLQADQQVLMDEYAEISRQLEKDAEFYESRLWFDYVNRVGADITASVSNLFTGGPYALITEAGYQVTEAFTWSTGLRGTKGLLNDYGWDTPDLPANLLHDRAQAANTLEATELAAAIERLAGAEAPDSTSAVNRQAGRTPDLQPYVAVDGTTAADLPDADGPGMQFLTGAGVSVGNTVVTPFIVQPIIEKQLGRIVSESTRVSMMRFAIQNGLPEAAVGSVTRRAAPSAIAQAMKTSLPSIKSTKGGLTASFAVVAGTQAFKRWAEEQGVNRAEIMQSMAEREIRWHLKRRQLVAHRLLAERYYENTLANYEAAIKVLASPPREVREARRKWTLEKPPVIQINPNVPLKLVVETKGYDVSTPVVVLPGRVGVPWPSVTQGQNIMKEAAHVLDLGPGGQNDYLKTYSLGNKALLNSGGMNVFVYSNVAFGEALQAGPPRSFFLDLDPTTPVTHFDDRTLKWHGQDKLATANSAVRFEFTYGVKASLRNKSTQTRVKPR